MRLSALPSSTIVDKIIPKNAFDGFTNSRHKQMLSSQVERIRWANKLSLETINLTGKAIKEIQVFEIGLRTEGDIHGLLDVIEKAIPYPIIFQIQFRDKYQLRASAKHVNPLNENTAVIDWTFSSPWSATKIALSLEKTLDQIFFDFCLRISGARTNLEQLPDLIEYERRRSMLNKTIKRLQTDIDKAVQFNRKVALNLALKKAHDALAQLVGNSAIDKAK